MTEQRLVCPRCGDVLDTAGLNDLGRDMLARTGPPRCLNGCGLRYEPQVTATITQLGPGTRNTKL